MREDGTVSIQENDEGKERGKIEQRDGKGEKRRVEGGSTDEGLKNDRGVRRKGKKGGGKRKE